jgi:hypothetical protein
MLVTIADAHTWRISLAITHDASAPSGNASHLAMLVQREIVHNPRMRIVSGTEIRSVLTTRAARRADLVARGKFHGADLAINIRHYEIQRNTVTRMGYATVWTAAMDSSAFRSIAQIAWLTTDTLAMERQIVLLMRRLLPPVCKRGCFAQIVEARTERDTSGLVSSAKARVIVRDDSGVPVANARVQGHWLANGRDRTPMTLRTNIMGQAYATWSAPVGAMVVSLRMFAVDTVMASGFGFDQQIPQRQVDETVAILGNARADLNDSRQYTRAATRAKRFLDTGESGMLWSEMAMTSLEGQDRRQQAERILKRAQSQISLESMGRGIAPSASRSRWLTGTQFTYDLFGTHFGDYRANAVDCDTCPPLELSVSGPKYVGFHMDWKYRMHDRLWLGVGTTFLFSEEEVRSSTTDTRSSSRAGIIASVTFPHEIASDIIVYGEAGLRLNSCYSTSAKRYWTNGNPHAELTTSTHLEPDPVDGSIHPGIQFGVGTMARVGDWMPVWMRIELLTVVDQTEESRTEWRGLIRVGMVYWN